MLGTFGGIVLDGESRAVVHRVDFEPSGGVGCPLLVITGGGEKRIIETCLFGDEARVLDFDGRTVLSYQPKGFHAEQMTAGDLDGHGRVEYYVYSWNNKVVQLDEEGKKRWERKLGVVVWDLAVLPDERVPRLVVRGERGTVFSLDYLLSLDFHTWIIFVDYDGSIIGEKRLEVAGPAGDLRIADWLGGPHIVTSIGKCICVFDLEGRLVLRHELSPSLGWLVSRDLIRPAATSVGPPGSAEYLAVLATMRAGYERAVFTIFNRSGEAVFQEVLGASTGLAYLGRTAEGGHSLLVGDGPRRVWRYTIQGAGYGLNQGGGQGV